MEKLVISIVLLDNKERFKWTVWQEVVGASSQLIGFSQPMDIEKIDVELYVLKKFYPNGIVETSISH